MSSRAERAARARSEGPAFGAQQPISLRAYARVAKDLLFAALFMVRAPSEGQTLAQDDFVTAPA
jgi:hypothetical protein